MIHRLHVERSYHTFFRVHRLSVSFAAARTRRGTMLMVPGDAVHTDAHQDIGN
jgi:hypothetical protein